jgi:hypothetical protein
MTKKREKPFHLDMSFDEALKRFAQTDPRELATEKNKPKKRRRSSKSSPSAATQESDSKHQPD